jgi:hypothetical protein
MKPTCFVLMPFAEEFNEVYEHAISPAAEAAGFLCHRADHAVGPNAIISDIIESIFSAGVIVADVTGSNPNVFYELGVAHTIDNKTVVICEKTDKPLPFDLAAYRVIFYRRTIEGIRTELRGKLEKHLTQLGSWKNHPTNPVQHFRPVKYKVPLKSQAELEQKVRSLEGDVRALRKEMRRGELRTLILSLREIEFRHLRGLAAEGPFNYEKHSAFLDELRKLRSLKLIRNKRDTTIGGVPQKGDLKDYLELTELTREVLEEMFRWIAE